MVVLWCSLARQTVLQQALPPGKPGHALQRFVKGTRHVPIGCIITLRPSAFVAIAVLSPWRCTPAQCLPRFKLNLSLTMPREPALSSQMLFDMFKWLHPLRSDFGDACLNNTGQRGIAISRQALTATRYWLGRVHWHRVASGAVAPTLATCSSM